MPYRLEVTDLTQLPSSLAWLSAREQAFYKTLRFPKRKCEWLGGRLALKRLVAQTALVPLPAVEVLPQPGGKPRLLVSAQPCGWAFSITHSHGYAVAALSQKVPFLGIDLEKIEPRSAAWKTEFFHPDELSGDGDEFLTALWTQKEAVVKLLGAGMSLNSFEVRCVNGQVRLYGRTQELFVRLGSPRIYLTTSSLLPGFMFTVAVGQK